MVGNQETVNCLEWVSIALCLTFPTWKMGACSSRMLHEANMITLFKHCGSFLAWQWTLWGNAGGVTCHLLLLAQIKLRLFLSTILKICLNEVVRWGLEFWYCCARSACNGQLPSISDPTAHKNVIIHQIPSWGLKNWKNGKNLFQMQKLTFREDIILLLPCGSCIYQHPLLRASLLWTFPYHHHMLYRLMCRKTMHKSCVAFFSMKYSYL